MSLESLHNDFKAGRLPKPEYIKRMHELHTVLMEYAQYIGQTDIDKIEIAGGEVIFRDGSTGIKMACSSASTRLAPFEIMNFGAYERADFTALLQCSAPGVRLFDVGANAGWYSLSLARVRPDLEIHAFEPLPEPLAMLRRNIVLNGTPAIQVHPFGLAEKDELVSFYFDPGVMTNSSLANLTDAPAVTQVECRTRRMDDFVKETGLGPGVIKCDVEGAELLMLRGAQETLRSSTPVVLAELLRKWSAKFGYHPNDVLETMRSLGYQVFTADLSGTLHQFEWVTESTEATTYFFLHPDLHGSSMGLLSAQSSQARSPT